MHRPELDGVRGIAIALVIVAHLGAPIGGWVGVQLFFVLSGYLITGLLIEERRRTGSTSLLGFYERRVRRLVPALAALLVVLLVTGLATGAAVGFAALYSANWARAASLDLGPLAHTWSLAIEEQFYLLWPLVAGLLISRRAGYAMLALAVLAAAVRIVAPENVALYATPLRADGLLVGSAIAVLGIRARGALVGVAALVLLAVLVRGGEPAAQWGIAAATIAAGVVVAGARAGVLSWRPLVWLGGISYALYLWHWPVAWLGLERYGWLPVLVASVVLAWASTRFIEAPFRRRHVRPAVELQPA